MLFDDLNIAVAMPPKTSCEGPDSWREQTYAAFYSERTNCSFVELSLACDPLSKDIYALQSLVCNPSAVPIISAARLEAYEHMVANITPVAPVVDKQRVAVYGNAPQELHGSANTVEASIAATHAHDNKTGAHATLHQMETGPEGFKLERNAAREFVYAALPSTARRAPQSPPRSPTRSAAYSTLPAHAPAAGTMSPRSLRKSHTHVSNMAQRPGVTLSHANLATAASAAESSLAKAGNYTVFNDDVLRSTEQAPSPLTAPGTRARSATYTVRTKDAASQSLNSVPPFTVSTSTLNAPSSSSVVPDKRSSPMSSVSMENLPLLAGRTSRTPSMIRTGSSKNLFALGSSGALLSSFIDESLEDDVATGTTATGIMSAPVSPMMPSRLTRVGHLGTIAQLQKFAC